MEEVEVSGKFCYDCCFKHLSVARVLYNEIHLGYYNPEHISSLIGNLAEAEAHIYEKHLELAVAIRKVRKEIWESIILIDNLHSASALDSIIEDLYVIITSVPIELPTGKLEDVLHSFPAVNTFNVG